MVSGGSVRNMYRYRSIACRSPGARFFMDSSPRRWSAVGVAGPRVVELLVVLAQQVAPVVVAVGGANDRVNVATGGLVVVESDSPLMVELDEDDGAVKPIVEDALLVDPPHPREVSLRQVALHLVHPEGRVTGGHTAHV